MKEEISNMNVQCYCCGYYTLEERGHYEICPVCFWEDGGGFELDEISGPNDMTLRQGRLNFLEFGACEKRFLEYVVKDPETTFGKGNL